MLSFILTEKILKLTCLVKNIWSDGYYQRIVSFIFIKLFGMLGSFVLKFALYRIDIFLILTKMLHCKRHEYVNPLK